MLHYSETPPDRRVSKLLKIVTLFWNAPVGRVSKLLRARMLHYSKTPPVGLVSEAHIFKAPLLHHLDTVPTSRCRVRPRKTFEVKVFRLLQG